MASGSGCRTRIRPTREPAVGHVGQLRHHRHDARRARHRRDRLHERSVGAAREGDLHRRRPAYQVEKFDYDNRKAFVREVECDYYTSAITYTKVTILDTFGSDAAESALLAPADMAALAAGADADSTGNRPKAHN
jgi:hypothetical protein